MMITMYEYTHTQTHSHEWKADIFLKDGKCFFPFHFWKDEVQKLDNQGDDEVDMQMHWGLSWTIDIPFGLIGSLKRQSFNHSSGELSYCSLNFLLLNCATIVQNNDCLKAPLQGV